MQESLPHLQITSKDLPSVDDGCSLDQSSKISKAMQDSLPHLDITSKDLPSIDSRYSLDISLGEVLNLSISSNYNVLAGLTSTPKSSPSNHVASSESSSPISSNSNRIYKHLFWPEPKVENNTNPRKRKSEPTYHAISSNQWRNHVAGNENVKLKLEEEKEKKKLARQVKEKKDEEKLKKLKSKRNVRDTKFKKSRHPLASISLNVSPTASTLHTTKVICKKCDMSIFASQMSIISNCLCHFHKWFVSKKHFESEFDDMLIDFACETCFILDSSSDDN